MKRLFPGTILVPLILLLGGCSVFGVATKGDLSKVAQENADSQRDLQERLQVLSSQLADISRDLSDIEQRMEPRLTRLETDLQKLEQDYETSYKELVDLEMGLKLELANIRSDFEVMNADVVRVQASMADVSSRAELASSQSEQALQAYYESLVEERQRLLRRLDDLDAKIRKWNPESLQAARAPQTAPLESPGDPIQTLQPVQNVDQPPVVPEEPFRLGPHNKNQGQTR